MRVPQERHYERVGGTATVTADVRLVAPTNRDLEQAVANGRFRDGLYFHLLYSYLAVFRSHLPPLRERGNDVLLLGERFMRETRLAARATSHQSIVCFRATVCVYKTDLCPHTHRSGSSLPSFALGRRYHADSRRALETPLRHG